MNQKLKHTDRSDFQTFVMEKTKHIALIAHDGKKQQLIEWAELNKEVLVRHFLCGTGTTAWLIEEKTGLSVTAYNSGPLGGDQQIGCRIVEGLIDFVIFLWDPLEAQAHDPDIKALLRIAVMYDIPIANNLATADFLLSSHLMDEPYIRQVKGFGKDLQRRLENYGI
jgi:methylglyoxal synthase